MNLICYPNSLMSGCANVCQIKRVKTADSAYKFLATGDNALRWKFRTDLNLPSGSYKTQIDSKSIRYINVKTDKVYSFVR